MPYSESIGFLVNLNKPDDIDFVFYVVAHEMGHQWWAHQLVGANMEGATLLSESLAQYSALMVMEKEYGRDTMCKFLAYGTMALDDFSAPNVSFLSALAANLIMWSIAVASFFLGFRFLRFALIGLRSHKSGT